LGCFDAKTLDFLPNQINLYQGFDANWENGLDHAKEKYKNPKSTTSSFVLNCPIFHLPKPMIFRLLWRP